MPTYAVELDTSGLLVEVRLNDVRIYRDDSAVPRIREDRLNHWIIPGENILEVWLGLPTDGDDSQSFELDWSRWEDEQTRRDADHISHYRWNGELKLERGVKRRVFDSIRTIHDGTGPWAWQDADDAPMTESDRGEIIQILQNLHAGIARRDIASVREALRIQNEEMARAYHVKPSERDSKQRDFLDRCVSAARWRLEPLHAGQLSFTPQAGGRLVFVTDARGLPPVRGVAEATTFDLPCGFSRVDGRWMVVR